MAGKGQKRKDKDRIVLRTGEGQRPNGTYEYRWTDKTGKRRRVYAKTLEELREKEKEIERDKSDGIKAEARYVTVNVLKELKQSHVFKTEERKALTRPQQDLLLDFLQRNHTYNHWYPIFAVMLGTGLRVGEATGLRWCDIDLDKGMVDVNHTLVYYCHRHEVEKNGCYFNVNTPKTETSVRQVPMMDFVKEAFLKEKEYQEAMGVECKATVDGYTDFIFVNRFGNVQHQGTLNKAIRRIIRDCNDEVLMKGEDDSVLLPHFSCHTLRHTFTTRMCEAGVNVKVIQDTLGHADIATTLNIYADVSKELKQTEFIGLDEFFKK